MQRCYGCMKEYGKDFDVCPHCGYVAGTEPESKSHLKPGTVLAGKYMLGRAIGHGGFGITYIAWEKVIQKTVAIKEFFPNAFSTRNEGETAVSCYNKKSEGFFKEGIRKMLDEAKRLSHFSSNENIVDIIEYFEENNTAYIVMEYLEGKDLKKYLEENGGKLEPKKAVEIILPVLNALEDMHKEKLIHRDISPDNIYLCDNGKVKLLDFGSARLAVDDSDKSLSVMVKRGYAPKEQYASRSKQGPWTDVYAVCATLYKMITGETPAESTERDETELKGFAEFGVTGFGALENLVFSGLADDYTERIQSVQELKTGLSRLLEGKRTSGVHKKKSKKEKKRIKTAVAAAAAVVVIAGAVLAVKFMPKKPEPVVEPETTTQATTQAPAIGLDPETAKGIYEDFLGSEGFGKTYPVIKDFIEHKIFYSTPSMLEMFKPAEAEGWDLSSAEVSKEYYDVDSDGTNEMFLTLKVNEGMDCRARAYLFDINAENTVFEGASWTLLSPEYTYNKLSLMQDEAGAYYFAEFTCDESAEENPITDGDFSKDCQKSYYNGENLVNEISLSVPDYLLRGDSKPAFRKCTEQDKSVYSYQSGVIAEYVPVKSYPDYVELITYEEACEEWNKIFSAKRISGVCDNAAQSLVDARVKLKDSGNDMTGGLSWKLYENGCLIVEGKGDMPHYGDDENPIPWGNYDEEIKYVIISEGITSIGAYAFSGCINLYKAIIPESVTEISDSAFDDCKSLESIDLPSGLIEISEKAFNGCSLLETVFIPKSVKRIDYNAFDECDNLQHIAVEEGNRYYCSDEYGVLFNYDFTELIRYPAGSLNESYTVSSNVKEIYFSAFWGCDNLKNIVISEGLESIPGEAFCYCDNLESVTIPSSVTKIGNNAFAAGNNIKVNYGGSWGEWRELGADRANLRDSNVTYGRLL